MPDAQPSDPIIDGPDDDGFHGVRFEEVGFNAGFGRMLARGEGADRSRVRFETRAAHGNVQGRIHGGFTLACLDQALFVGPAILGRLTVGRAVTLTVSTQFVGAGHVGTPLDAVVDIARQTRQMMFLTGTIEQGAAAVLTFQASLRLFEADRGGAA